MAATWVHTDFLFKIVMAGPDRAGKTSICYALDNEPVPDAYIMTIGVDFKSKMMSACDATKGRSVRYQIWDTAGQERFRAIANAYYRGAHCVMFVYAAHDRTQFDRIIDMIRTTESLVADGVTRVLVAHQFVGHTPVVTLEEAQKATAQWNVHHTSVNAMTRAGIDQLMPFAIGHIVARHLSAGSVPPSAPPFPPPTGTGTSTGTSSGSTGGWMASLISHLKQSAAAASSTAPAKSSSSAIAASSSSQVAPPLSVSNNGELSAEWQATIDEEKMALMICDAKFGAMRAELLATKA